MQIHIALYRWKDGARPEDIKDALAGIEALATQVDGIINIFTGENTSPYSEGYTHVILVQGENQAAIDAYRGHPRHKLLAERIEAMEESGIGVDFKAG